MAQTVPYREIRGPVSFKLNVTSLTGAQGVELRELLEQIHGVRAVRRDFGSDDERDIFEVTMQGGYENQVYRAWIDGGLIVSRFQDSLPKPTTR